MQEGEATGSLNATATECLYYSSMFSARPQDFCLARDQELQGNSAAVKAQTPWILQMLSPSKTFYIKCKHSPAPLAFQITPSLTLSAVKGKHTACSRVSHCLPTPCSCFFGSPSSPFPRHTTQLSPVPSCTFVSSALPAACSWVSREDSSA